MNIQIIRHLVTDQVTAERQQHIVGKIKGRLAGHVLEQGLGQGLTIRRGIVEMRGQLHSQDTLLFQCAGQQGLVHAQQIPGITPEIMHGLMLTPGNGQSEALKPPNHHEIKLQHRAGHIFLIDRQVILFIVPARVAGQELPDRRM